MSTKEGAFIKRLEKQSKTIASLEQKIKALKSLNGDAKRLETYLLARNAELTLENIKLRKDI